MVKTKTPRLGDAEFRKTVTDGIGKKTFEIPTSKPEVGGFVKLALEFDPNEIGPMDAELPAGYRPPSGERMWFRVTAIDGDNFRGVCDSHPLFTHIHGVALGDEVQFEKRHIFIVDPPQP